MDVVDDHAAVNLTQDVASNVVARPTGIRLSCNALYALSKQPGGFAGKKGQHERRRAWLWLLGLAHLEKTLAQCDHCIAGHADPETAQRERARPHVAKDRIASDSRSKERQSDSSRTRSDDTSTSRATSSSPLNEKAFDWIPLDTDGWQIPASSSRESAISAVSIEDAENEREAEYWNVVASLSSTKPKPVDEWTTAVSRKKARRRRGAQQDMSASRFESASTAVGGKFLRNDDHGAHKSKKKRRKKHGNTDYDLSARLKAHRDEAQVALDVRRSFIELSDSPERRRRREQLMYVIRGVLRRHPSLNYYQGYHDIASILLLVLLPNAMAVESGEADNAVKSPSTDALEAVIEVLGRLSLHFLRDGMARDMTPTLGHLKLLRAVLVQCSAPKVVSHVDTAGPLPYFALPWLLSIFSHDVSSSLAISILDFVLARGPGSVICLAAALIESAPSGPVDADSADVHHALSQIVGHMTGESLPSLFDRADEIASATNLTSRDWADSINKTPHPFGRHIMGPQSVLYTWRTLPSPGTLPVTSAANVEAWRKADVSAAATLSSDTISQIVVDALPTPPPSPPLSSISDAYAEDVKSLTASSTQKRGRRDARHTHSASGRAVTASTQLAVLGAVSAIGMAVILIYGGGGAALSSSSGATMSSNVLGRDAAVALLRSSDALRQLFRQALQ